MIDYHIQLANTLSNILPTHYEMTLHSGLAMPCLSYLELTNFTEISGDTLEFSVVSYQITVWADNIADLQRYSKEVDAAVRPLGFRRTSSQELYDNQNSRMRKVISYEATGYETI